MHFYWNVLTGYARLDAWRNYEAARRLNAEEEEGGEIEDMWTPF